MKDELLFCPLGGSGEIGMNMNLFAYGKPGEHKWIMVDIGVTFADDTIPGVDLIYPDPGFIVDKKEYMNVEIGNGPVNALDKALRKSLMSFYPVLEDLELTDFKVRILSSEKGTDAIVRVIIESKDKEGNFWTTVGVSTNIIDASYNALRESLIFKLIKNS